MSEPATTTAAVPTAKPYKLRPRVWGAALDNWRDDVKPGDTIEVVSRRGKRWTTTVERVLDRKEYRGTDETGEPVYASIVATAPRDSGPAMTTRERKEARIERRQDWAAGRRAKSEAGFERARQIADHIPLGQPILVGHHSERGHRRDLGRIDSGMRQGVESADMAREHDSKAAGIELQLKTAIYSDDPDVIERLTEKVAALEEERSRMKEINVWIRKNARGFKAAGWYPTPEEVDAATVILKRAHSADLALTIKEAGQLAGAFGFGGRLCYDLTLLGANIRRNVKRLEQIKRDEGVS